jgi:hypothetical protein
VAAPVADDLRARLGALAELSLEALPSMFDGGSGLFCQKTVAEGELLSNRGSNVHYTATTTVGILRQPDRDPESVFPLGRALDALHDAVNTATRPGLLAEIVWAMALAEDPRGAPLAQELARREDFAGCDSAALGNVVNGLAIAAEAYPQQSGPAMESCRRWAVELLERFSPAAELFGPIGRPTGVRSGLLRRLTSFAAQVYPLHGLAAYHRVSGEAPAPALARVADRIVDAQGPLGQWWWLYSTKGKTILEGYPVYSVHQDGMAFMALLPLEALGVGDYRKPLALGLDWLSKRNELLTDLVRRDPPIVFRNIQRVGSDADAMFGISRRNLAQVVARSLRPGVDHTTADPSTLEVLHECRPYHLGWVLYARALECG